MTRFIHFRRLIVILGRYRDSAMFPSLKLDHGSTRLQKSNDGNMAQAEWSSLGQFGELEVNQDIKLKLYSSTFHSWHLLSE